MNLITSQDITPFITPFFLSRSSLVAFLSRSILRKGLAVTYCALLVKQTIVCLEVIFALGKSKMSSILLDSLEEHTGKEEDLAFRGEDCMDNKEEDCTDAEDCWDCPDVLLLVLDGELRDRECSFSPL